MAFAGKTRGERTEGEKAVAAAGGHDEVEEITEPAREAPGHGVYDQAPSRVVIAGVSPEVDGGQFPIKRTVGEEVADYWWYSYQQAYLWSWEIGFHVDSLG